MSKSENIELSRGQRLAGNLTAGFFLIACGIFLLLCGVKVFPLAVRDVAAPAILFSIGLVLLVNSIVQRNTVSLWISFCFIVPGMVSTLAAFTPAGYSNLYPIYIAVPAVASLFTMLMSREFLAHIKVVLFFGAAAGIFSLQSSGVCGWGVVVPLVVVLVGLTIVYFSIKTSKEAGDDEN